MGVSKTVYERLARAVTARDVQSRFKFVWHCDQRASERALITQYLHRAGSASTDPVLLTATHHALGTTIETDRLPYAVWDPLEPMLLYATGAKFDSETFGQDRDDDEMLDEGASPSVKEISTKRLISADTALLDLFGPLSRDVFRGLLVVDGTKITGVIRPQEMLSPVAKNCLLALALEFESAALTLCRLYPKQCFNALKTDRQTEARGTLRRKLASKARKDDRRSWIVRRLPKLIKPHAGEAEDFYSLLLIECTNLNDKLSMIVACELLPRTSAEELRGVGRKVHALRNALAHPGTDAEDISFSETVELVKQTRKLIARAESQFKLDLRQLGKLGRGN